MRFVTSLIAFAFLAAGPALAADDDLAEWNRLNDAARPLHEAGDTTQALAAAQRLLDFTLAHEKTLGAGKVGTSWYNLGKANEAAGNFPEARAAFEHALPPLEQAYGAQSSYTALTLNSLADVELRADHYGSAEKYARRALELAKAEEPPGEMTARFSNTLAWICFNQQRYAEAAELYAAALNILQSQGDPNRPEIAMIRNQLAAAKGGIPSAGLAGTVAMSAAADAHTAFIEKIASLARQRNEAELLACFDEPTRKEQEAAIRQYLDKSVYPFFAASSAISPYEHVTGASAADGRRGLWHYGFVEDKKHKLQPFQLAILDTSAGPRLLYINTGSCAAGRHPAVGPCKAP